MLSVPNVSPDDMKFVVDKFLDAALRTGMIRSQDDATPCILRLVFSATDPLTPEEVVEYAELSLSGPLDIHNPHHIELHQKYVGYSWEQTEVPNLVEDNEESWDILSKDLADAWYLTKHPRTVGIAYLLPCNVRDRSAVFGIIFTGPGKLEHCCEVIPGDPVQILGWGTPAALADFGDLWLNPWDITGDMLRKVKKEGL